MRLTKVFILLVLFYVTVSPAASEVYNKQLLDAAAMGNVQAVRDLVNVDSCDINTVNKSGFSSLMLACCAGQVQVVEELLKKNASVHIANEAGQTALLLVVEHANQKDLNRIEIVKNLIKAGACVDVCDSEGNTPLSRALFKADIGVVQELVAHGAKAVKKVNPTTHTDTRGYGVTEEMWGDPGEAEYINDPSLLKKQLYNGHFLPKSSGVFSGRISTNTKVKVRPFGSYSGVNTPIVPLRGLRVPLLGLLRFMKK